MFDMRHFMDNVWRQVESGGRRYVYSKDKEWTDHVCEIAGLSWIGGNIVKYCGEIQNDIKRGKSPQEVNFYKIAAYAFIWWVKHHKQKDTGLKAKSMYFPEFRELVEGIYELTPSSDNLERIEWAVRRIIKDDTAEHEFFDIAAQAKRWASNCYGQYGFSDTDEGEEV